MFRKQLCIIASAIARIADDSARYAAALALADELQRHNPRFDNARFMLACRAVDSDDARR